MNVNELHFSCRVINCLAAERIKTVDELCNMTEREMLSIRQFGRTSLEEVKAKLAAIGRSLSNGDPAPAPKRPTRYGIIPCRRCAFFVRYLTGNDLGQCQRFAPRQDENGVVWPEVNQCHGCGDGLLREEAAPLPPEPEQEPKP